MRTRGELTTPEEFARDHRRAGAATTSSGCGDVAEVEVGAEDERTVARYNGQPAVGLGIVKQSQGRARWTWPTRCARRCPSCARLLPEGHAARRRLRLVDLHPGVDRTRCATRSSSPSCLVVLVDLRLPEEPARHAHPDGGDPGLDHRRLRRRLLRWASRSTSSRCWRWCWRSAWWWTTPSWCSRTSTATWRWARRACGRPSTARRRSASRCSRPRSRWWRCSSRWRS